MENNGIESYTKCNTNPSLGRRQFWGRRLRPDVGSILYIIYWFHFNAGVRPPSLFWGRRKIINGHTGARTQDRGVISTALYQLSYTTVGTVAGFQVEYFILSNMEYGKIPRTLRHLSLGWQRSCPLDQWACESFVHCRTFWLIHSRAVIFMHSFKSGHLPNSSTSFNAVVIQPRCKCSSIDIEVPPRLLRPCDRPMLSRNVEEMEMSANPIPSFVVRLMKIPKFCLLLFVVIERFEKTLMPPPRGFEPRTLWLTAIRSTNWAIEDEVQSMKESQRNSNPRPEDHTRNTAP